MLDDYSTAMSRPQDPWQTRVDTHREFLKHNLYADDQLLHSLMRRRLKSGGAFLLTRADKENVESNTGSTTNMTAPTNSTKVNTLVEILRFKGPKEETFELLCHSLYEIKRVWIVQELMGHSDESQDPWQTRVDTHREFLKHNLHVDDELLNSLMGKRLESGASLLTQIDKEDNIESSALTNSAKVDALVKVLRFKGPKEETFNLLCLSLYDVRRVWIVQELMGWEQSHSDESDSKQGALEGKSTSMEPGVKGWKDRLTNDTQSSKQDYSKAAVADSRGAALEDQLVEDRHIKALEFEIFSNTDELVSFGKALMGWSHTRTLNYFSDMKGSKVNYQFSSLLHAWVDKEDAPTIGKLLSAFKEVEKEGAAGRILIK